ncbi:MAG: histidine kinase [Pseudomonadota bacterium]
MALKKKPVDTFLPDFCSRESLFVVILIAELLTLVLTMTRQGSFESLLSYFAVLSLFVLWIALTDVAMLCHLNRLLAKLSAGALGVIAFFLLQFVTVTYTAIVDFVGTHFSLTANWSPSWFWENGVRNFAISSIVSFIALRYFYIQHQRELTIQAESRTRIEALQARIRPHFLFNSMNIIASLTRSDPQKAERTVEDLSDLFRASLSATQEEHTLEDELTLARSYLRIENERLGDRLKVEWVVPRQVPELFMPSLIIQPLVENTIYHGIETMEGGGTVRVIAGTCGPRHYCVEISNPVNTHAETHSGNRMARDNILQRLELAFGDNASLTTFADDTEYHVTLRLPMPN